jgi:glycosyltransferase involved in cell wall biosynthesis
MPSPVLHVGIWGADTMAGPAQAGAETLLVDLVDTLLAADGPPRITLLVPPEDRDRRAWALQRWGEQVRLFPPPGDTGGVVARGVRLLRRAAARLDRVLLALSDFWLGLVERIKRHVLLELRGEIEYWRMCRRQGALVILILHLPALLFLVPVLALFGWLGGLVHQLLIHFLIPTVRFPFGLLASVLPSQEFSLARQAVAAGCDVWLAPPAWGSEPLLAPHGLTILAGDRHLSLAVYPAEQWRSYAQAVAAGTVQPPAFPVRAEQVRVFALDTPGELNPDGPATDLPVLRQKYQLGPRFLFYPGELGDPSKGHCMLLRALHMLHTTEETDKLELVCTHRGPVPGWYGAFFNDVPIQEYVHFLGVIPPEDVRGLYQYALVVPLPSSHEDSGLPLLESLRHGCAVTCADIPAFRQLLAEVPERVLFFDPTNLASITTALRRTINQQQRFAHWHREAYRQLVSPRWEVLARNVLAYLEEVCRPATLPGRDSRSPGVPWSAHHAA